MKCNCTFLYDVNIDEGKGVLEFDFFYNYIRNDNFVKTISHYRRIKLGETRVRVCFTSSQSSLLCTRTFRVRPHESDRSYYMKVFPIGTMYSVNDFFSFDVTEIPYVVGPLLSGERISSLCYPILRYIFTGERSFINVSINVGFTYEGIEEDMNPNYILPRAIIDGTAEPAQVIEGYTFYSQDSEKKVGILKAIEFVDEEGTLDEKGYYFKQVPSGQYVTSIKIRLSTISAIDPPEEQTMPEGMSWFKNSNGKQVFGQVKDILSLSKSDQEGDLYNKAFEYISKNVIKRKPDSRVKEIGAKIFSRITSFAKQQTFPVGITEELLEPAWITKIKDSKIIPKLTEVVKKAIAKGDEDKVVITAGEDEVMKQVEVEVGAKPPFYYHKIQYFRYIAGAFQSKYEPLDIRIMAPVLAWPFYPPVLDPNSVCIVVMINGNINTSHYVVASRNILNGIEPPNRLTFTGVWGFLLTDRDDKDKKPYEHQIRVLRSTSKILPTTSMYLCSLCVPDVLQTSVIEIPNWVFKYSALQVEEENNNNIGIESIETIPIY